MVSSTVAALFSRRFGGCGGSFIQWPSSFSAVSRNNIRRLFCHQRCFAAATEEAVHKKPATAAPLFMVSSSQNPESRYFYDPKQEGDIRLNRVLHLPQLAVHHCIGFSQGFPITVKHSRTTKSTPQTHSPVPPFPPSPPPSAAFTGSRPTGCLFITLLPPSPILLSTLCGFSLAKPFSRPLSLPSSSSSFVANAVIHHQHHLLTIQISRSPFWA